METMAVFYCNKIQVSLSIILVKLPVSEKVESRARVLVCTVVRCFADTGKSDAIETWLFPSKLVFITSTL